LQAPGWQTSCCRFPPPINVNGERVKQTGYISTELTDYAIDWLKQQKTAEKLLLLYLSHKAVHANVMPEDKYGNSFKDLPFERPKSESRSINRRPVSKTITDAAAAAIRPWISRHRKSWENLPTPMPDENA
jgi:hypothetical protein